MQLSSESYLAAQTLLSQLIKCPSITPNEAGCFDVITTFCESIKPTYEYIDRNNTKNILIYFGNKSPALVFCGHVDVVPPGNLDAWTHHPFQGKVVNHTLFGRGAVDMKGSIAAFLAALTSPYLAHPLDQIAILLTSDEEGTGEDGTEYALAELKKRGFRFSHALVGEPTSKKHVGDIIKVGRRGSLTAEITIQGKQGHVAYPHLAVNPIHIAQKVLNGLIDYPWKNPAPSFPITQCVCMHVDAVNNTTNVIPDQCSFTINFRYDPQYSLDQLTKLTEDILEEHQAKYTVSWRHSAHPFYKEPNTLFTLLQNSIQLCTGQTASSSTDGGTSDARFIHHYVDEIVEFGPKNQTAHQIDECIELSDLSKLIDIYFLVIQEYIT